ncbi:MAG: hypothetical protein CUN55_19125, partial [Phototrophicales bacterium]
EYIDDILYIIGSLQFKRKAISQSLWQLFPLLFRAATSWAKDSLSDIVPIFENYIAYGNKTFLDNSNNKSGVPTNQRNIDRIMQLCTSILKDKTANEIDVARTMQLLECMLEYCSRGTLGQRILQQCIVLHVPWLQISCNPSIHT